MTARESVVDDELGTAHGLQTCRDGSPVRRMARTGGRESAQAARENGAAETPGRHFAAVAHAAIAITRLAVHRLQRIAISAPAPEPPSSQRCRCHQPPCRAQSLPTTSARSSFRDLLRVHEPLPRVASAQSRLLADDTHDRMTGTRTPSPLFRGPRLAPRHFDSGCHRHGYDANTRSCDRSHRKPKVAYADRAVRRRARRRHPRSLLPAAGKPDSARPGSADEIQRAPTALLLLPADECRPT